MKWNELTSIAQLDQIDEESKNGKVMILKHSTRCSISNTALNRLERNWKEGNEAIINPYYLDLLNHRDISNAIAERYKVEHQSPQILVIVNGKCTFSQTHSEIRLEEILEEVN
ncbi:MAG: bacillithiol system redox-active protein YtxJ [Bacteroidetes bacterium]|nr:bacillithiol system redox-active protein YtxJ [Bacteroidota bacterium]